MMSKKMKLILCIALPLVIGAGLILFFVLGGGGREAVPLTLARYEEVEQGMLYEDVVAMLGNGILDSETGEKGDDSHLAVYIWPGENEGSRAVIIFHGGRVASMTYQGLS